MCMKTVRSPDIEYFENVVALLEQEGFALDCSKEHGTIRITIAKGNLQTETRIKEHSSHAEVAEKIATAIKWWSSAISSRCANKALQCGGYLEFSEKYPSALAVCNEIDKTVKKLEVLRFRWYARTRAEVEKNNLASH